MTAASRATFVVGVSRAGPTCSAVSTIYLCSLGARACVVSVSFKGPLSVGGSGGGLELGVGLLAAPDSPDDASRLVGHGDGGLVLDVGFGEVVSPGAEAVWLSGLGVVEDGAGAVDEEGAEVAVTALGDAAEVSLKRLENSRGVRPR